MKIFRAKGNAEFIIDNNDVLDSSLIKVKISTIIPTLSDIEIYDGRFNTVYPIIPCHMATAIISEDKPEYDLKRGAKVIINPYILSSIDEEGLKEVDVYGLNTDGFLRDFAAVPIDNIIPFPEEVKENEAVFTEMLAIALAAINAFPLNKGEYVAIVGGSVISNLIAQLALYYQAIPILISNDARMLEIAEKCGITYVINDAHQDPHAEVLSITGGRMAEHTVLHAKTGVPPHFLFSLAGRNGDCLIVSLNSTIPKIETNIGVISRKHLTVKGVSSGVDEISSAINLIAQKQLDFSHFIDKVVNFDDAKSIFDEMREDPLRYVCPVIKIQ